MVRRLSLLKTVEYADDLKQAQELSEPQTKDNKPVDNTKGSKRGRASPEPEDESIASPPKKQKTEVEGDDATIPGQDGYSIWDAMLWGSSFPGITESLSPFSPQKVEEALPDIGSVLAPAPTVPKPTIPKSQDFKIFEDPEEYSMAGREVRWVPEYDNENKENEPPEFEVGVEEANVVSEYQDYHYPSWSRRLPREILGELQHN